MAKMTKKRRVKRRITFTGVCFFFMIFALLLSFAASLFVRTRNDSLTMEIQATKEEIASVKSDNRSISIEIQTLENKDRVYVVAENAGLDQNQENIISIGE